MLFIGWQDESGNTITSNSIFDANSQIKLLPKTISIDKELLNGSVDSDGKATDSQPVPTTANYENGLYVQGTQVRVQLSQEDPALGLRFINVVNDDLIKALKSIEGITNVKFGTLVISSKRLDSELTVDTPKAKNVIADKIWRNSQTLNSNYEKYTACVVNIPQEQFTTSIVIRPYITYTDTSGIIHHLYGEQYSGVSIYSVALSAYESGIETKEVTDYLYKNIISKVSSDNDTEIEF